MKKSKRFLSEFDYQIFLIFIILAIIGLVMQLDISQERRLTMFYKQLLWSFLSLIVMIFTFFYADMNLIRKYIKILLLVTILLLLWVLINPHVVNGAHRSIKIGPINFQPSLLARIVLIIFIADRLDDKKNIIKYLSFKEFIKEFSSMFLVIALVYGLILAEKHLSILIILSMVIVSMFWIAEVKYKTLFILVGLTLLIAIVGFFIKSKFIGNSDTEYRGRRIKIYMQYSLLTRVLGVKHNDVSNDEKMQIKESLIALSMGKLFGLGPGKSIAKNYYLAESRTDYIYGIIGEEYGFIGAFLILIIYGWFFLRIFKLHNRLDNNFLKLSVFGLGLNFFYNAMVNIGVNISALPSTGVTLPFISYGGTSFLINALSLGILLNISSEWKKR